MESRNHIFFTCPFSLLCWRYIYLSWTLLAHAPDILFIEGLKEEIQQPFYLDIIVVFCWSIGVIKNDFTFKGVDPSLYRARSIFDK
jgi:hypothetical protein